MFSLQAIARESIYAHFVTVLICSLCCKLLYCEVRKWWPLSGFIKHLGVAREDRSETKSIYGKLQLVETREPSPMLTGTEHAQKKICALQITPKPHNWDISIPVQSAWPLGLWPFSSSSLLKLSEDLSPLNSLLLLAMCLPVKNLVQEHKNQKSYPVPTGKQWNTAHIDHLHTSVSVISSST